MTNLRKIEAIMVYFANQTNTKYLGKVKLMKLFYFLDFNHVKQYASPVTYDAYYNLDHGPIPSRIKNLVDDFCDEPAGTQLSEILDCEYPDGTSMCRMKPKRQFTEKDRKLFSETEFKILEQVATKYKNAKTQEIEEDSHKQAPWKNTSTLDQIPYYLAAQDEDSRVTEEDIKLASI